MNVYIMPNSFSCPREKLRLSVIVGTKKTGTSRSHGAVEDSYPVAIDVFLG